MGFNSPSLNPENVQVQYLQKIALRAENPAAPSVFYYLDSFYFLHEVQFSTAIGAAYFPFPGPVYFPHEVRFSAAIEAAYFPAVTTRPLGPRLSAIFTSCLSFYIEAIKIRDQFVKIRV